MAPGMEIEVAIREHDIPNEWPEGLDQELSKAGKLPNRVRRPSRFTRLATDAIDGEDRAILMMLWWQCPKMAAGVMVAIADVSTT